MSELKKINILRSIGKLYLSLLAFQTMNGVMAFPAETKSTSKTASSDNDKKSSSSGSSTDNSESSSSSSTDSKTSSSPNKSDLGSGQICQPNTNSCGTGESCIRFDTDKEDKFTCHKTELAFCESNDYCKKVLGESYKHCYVPPWSNGLNQKKQCFTEHGIGSTCVNDIHCANTLSCVDNVCVSNSKNSSGFDFDSAAATSSSGGNGTILGINKWVFISVIAFPILILIFCFWCWIIGRSSSKDIENKKKEKYENELKKLTLPSTVNNNNGGTSDKRKSTATNNGEVIVPNYVNPQKEIEEEVGKRGFRSLFSRKKKGDDEAAGTATGTSTTTATAKEATSVDISSSTKVGGKAPINTSITSDTQKKMKKNLTLVNLADKNNSGAAAHARKVNGKKTPSTPVGSSKHSSIASFAQDTASNASSAATPSKAAAKARVGNKKKTSPKKSSKGPSSSGNDTNNSTSSKQSSQRGLVNNASGMSSALSGQSASYFSNVSALDAQSYYQQMYNVAAAQAAAAQNPYYALYMQNPSYYAAAAQQSAATYYAAAAAAAAQNPNASLLYGTYQNPTGYR